LEASHRASSCRDAIRETLNKPDAYNQYKTLMNKMNNTCIMKLSKIEKQEVAKRCIRGRRAMLVPVTENKKVITEEFRAWRSGGSQNRWRVGSLKKTAIAGNGFGPAPNVNKTVIQKPKRIA